MPLNRKKPYGTIHPPEQRSGAAYEQNNRFYNHAGLEVDRKTGKVLEEAQKPTEALSLPGMPRASEIRALLATADRMQVGDLRVQAAAMLGTIPPASRGDIIDHLNRRAEALEAMDGKAARAAGTPVPANGNVDLGAWGRGEVKYLFDDVQKAIHQQMHRVVNTKVDAIEALIAEGILDPTRAMDVGEEAEPEPATADAE